MLKKKKSSGNYDPESRNVDYINLRAWNTYKDSEL